MTSQEDREAIAAVARDYIVGWVDGDAKRLGGSLHPELRKRSVVDPASEALTLEELDVASWLERVAARGPKPFSRDADIRVLDVYDRLATVAVLSEPFMDYIHLAKFGDRWLILNVLWQERTSEG